MRLVLLLSLLLLTSFGGVPPIPNTTNTISKVRVSPVTVSTIIITTTNILPQCETGNASVVLGWEYDFVSNPTADGFRIYYGTESGVYNASVDIDSQVKETSIDHLTAGTTYFAITARDSVNNLESEKSSELSFNIPFLTTKQFSLQINKSTEGVLTLQTKICPFQTITIQYTTDFVNWSTLATTTADQYGNIIYSDLDPTRGAYRFYRATTP